jgi:predicted PurR-regulated permease PerM
MSDRRAFLVVIAVALLVLWAVRGILAPFIISAGIAYAFSPVVTSARARTGWPRAAVVGVGYLLVIAGVVALALVSSGRISGELAALSTAGPDLVANALRQLIGGESVSVAGSTVTVADLAGAVHAAIDGIVETPTSAIHLAGFVVDLLLQTVLVLIVTFYLLVDGPRMREWALDLVPEPDRPRYGALLDRIQETLSKWLRGQLLLIALISVVSYVFLGPILHVPYALAIGLLTGVLEVIPLVGPLIAGAIAIVAALASGGPTTAAVVGIGYFVIRQVEDQLVMPAVIGRAVHLHPVVTIFAVLAGLSLYGVLGGLLGVPVAAAANVVFHDVYADRVRPARVDPPPPPRAASPPSPPAVVEGRPHDAA